MFKLTLKTMCALAATTVVLTSCDKKTQEDDGTLSNQGDYSIALTSNGDGEVATDYIVNTYNLKEGAISLLGNGIEQSGYHFYNQSGKYLTTVTYTDANVASVYKLNANDQLEEHVQFALGKPHLFYSVDEENVIAMNIPRGGSENATFYQINVATGNVVEKAASVLAPTKGNGEQAYFSGMVRRGDKLYVPFFPIINGSFESNKTDSAYVAIYSYPGLEYQGVTRDERTGPIGAYAAQGHIFTTENNDIYSVSPCAIACGAPQETRPSGILRIKAGEDTFDPAYFFNLEAATGGYKVNNAAYIGNNKVLVSVFSFQNATLDDKWSRRDCKLAIVDVVAQTVNYISGVPIHYGGPDGMFPNQFIQEPNGMLYIKITNDEGMFIYEVDPNSYTGTKGIQLNDSKTVRGIFNLKQ